MGLLDAVIGGLAGGGQGGGGAQAELLRVIVSMLANGGGRGAAPAGGGLGGMLGGVLGAALGGGAAQAPTGGGIEDLLARFRQAGLGDVASSWVSTGPNAPISPEQLGKVLGGDTLAQIAAQLGVPQDVAAGQMSQLLPEVVDHLTPQGQVPAGGLGGVDELLGMLMRR